MYNKYTLISLIGFCLAFSSCKTKYYPFDFNTHLTPKILSETFATQDNNKSAREKASQVASSSLEQKTVHIYKTKFIEGWLEQDNFLDWAVLNENRQREFASYDGGQKHLYNCYILLAKTPNEPSASFILFTVQSESGEDGATGFGKIYYGKLITNGKADYLNATRILKLKFDAATNQYTFKGDKNTHLRFILKESPSWSNPSDELTITKVTFGDKNELSGSKVIEIPVDKVMGSAGSLKYTKRNQISIP
ncbi:hypothetical protein [Pedobacter aquatilis]|uniref:hypothetical protein n=1 Tax=Pedobacter aquatilis TaxID=351343 RepID=UPI00292E20D2|nr:hypothetical protein [Pedobacter aquatilis]